jgi:hypothetical protein
VYRPLAAEFFLLTKIVKLACNSQPMVNSTFSNLNIYYSVEQQHSNNYLPHCILKWRQGQLLVSLGNQDKQPYISAFESEQQVVECLKQSPVRLVRLDLNLGEAVLNRWADACEKPINPYLYGEASPKNCLE